MKMLIGGLAATFAATMAFAQTTTSPTPTNPSGMPSNGAMSTPTDSGTTGTTGSSNSDAPMIDESRKSDTMLTQKDGKWWKGDRRASKAEIAEYQRNHPK